MNEQADERASARVSDNGGGEMTSAPNKQLYIALAAKSDYCSTYRRYIKCARPGCREAQSERESICVRGLSLKINVK